jgi:hypothetical protein
MLVAMLPNVGKEQLLMTLDFKPCKRCNDLRRAFIEWNDTSAAKFVFVKGALSLGVKRPGREADHSHLVPRSRMRGAIPSLPQYVFMTWCLAKHRDNFTFTFKSNARN